MFGLFKKSKPVDNPARPELSPENIKKLVWYQNRLTLMMNSFRTQTELAQYLGIKRAVLNKLLNKNGTVTSYLSMRHFPRTDLTQADQLIKDFNARTYQEIRKDHPLGDLEVPFREELDTGSYRIIFDGFDFTSSIDFNDHQTYPLLGWTYTLADVKKLHGSIPDKYWGQVWIIVDSSVGDSAAYFLHNATKGEVNIRLDKRNHRKITLYAANKILIGSANFGHTINKECMVEITSASDYGWLMDKFMVHWESLDEFPGANYQSDTVVPVGIDRHQMNG